MMCIIIKNIAIEVFDNVELIYKEVQKEYPFLIVRQGERKSSILCDSIEDLNDLYECVISQIKEGVKTLVIEEQVNR